MANGLCDAGQHQDVESDADEEVRSLDLPGNDRMNFLKKIISVACVAARWH
jgi:hypothetical protein